MTLGIYLLIIYLVVLILITFISRKKTSIPDYINSGKDLSANESTWTTFGSLLTGYNFVIGVTFAYLYGFWYLFAFVGAGLAFVLMYFIYKKNLFNLQKSHDLFSIGDYFGLRYGEFSKYFVNIIILGSLLLFLVLQLFVNTNLFSVLLVVEKITALLLTVLIVCLYLWFGGFKVSVKTDIFQGVLMLPIILSVLFFPFNLSLEKVHLIFDTNQIWFAIGLAALQFFSLLGQAESFQRIFASRDSRSLKIGLIRAVILLFLVAGSIAYLGINFKLSGVPMDPSNLFIDSVIGVVPTWLASILTISLIAAFMGTIDSSAFAFGVIASKLRGREVSVKYTRLFMLVGIVVSALASVYLFSFLSSVFALISLVSIIGSAFLASYMFKLKAKEMNLFLLSGVLVFVLGIIFDFITDNPVTSMIPILVSFVSITFVFFFRKVKGYFLKP